MNKEKSRLRRELNRLHRQKTILWSGVLFLVAVLLWTAVSILTSQKKVKIDANLTKLAKPIVPRLDAEVFALIESKRELSYEELSHFPIYVYFRVDQEKEGFLTNITDLSMPVEFIELEDHF